MDIEIDGNTKIEDAGQIEMIKKEKG